MHGGIYSHLMMTSQKYSQVNHLKICQHTAIRTPACQWYVFSKRTRKPNSLDKKIQTQTQELKHEEKKVNRTGKLINTKGITNIWFSFELSQWSLHMSKVFTTKLFFLKESFYCSLFLFVFFTYYKCRKLCFLCFEATTRAIKMPFAHPGNKCCCRCMILQRCISLDRLNKHMQLLREIVWVNIGARAQKFCIWVLIQ